jgi:hypothetical protein
VKYATTIKERVQFEYWDYEEWLENNSVSTKVMSNRREFFQLFNKQPYRPLYLAARDTECLTMLLIKLFRKLYTAEFPNVNITQVNQALMGMCKKDASSFDKLVGAGSEYVGRCLVWLYAG